jgi:hypothetical protein
MNKFKHTLLILLVSIISCDKYLDIEPIGQVIPKSVDEYRSFLTSAYAITKDYKVLTTYRTDELALNANSVGADQYKDIFIWNDLNLIPLTRAFPYASLYTTIFYTNHVIQNAETMEGLLVEKEQLIGEAYALRAMQYFELANLYSKPYNNTTATTDAGVPITTEYNSDKTYPIQPLADVYNLIVSDIEKAEGLLNVEQQITGYNYRFSKLAIKSFKARVYLYQKEWQKAIDAATEALAIKSNLMDLNAGTSMMPSEYNAVESILALETVSSFDIANNATISNQLLTSYDQVNDLRFSLYFTKNADNTFSSKKSADSKYKCSYRTSELYLILAEAYAELGDKPNALLKLNEFTKNRYLPTAWDALKIEVANLSTEDLITEILEERKKEFAIEGHRWNDLRRSTQSEIKKAYKNQLYTLAKNDARYVIPFPKDATINNPDL